MVHTPTVRRNEEPLDYLTPEQRFQLIAEVLSDLALEVVNADHEAQ